MIPRPPRDYYWGTPPNPRQREDPLDSPIINFSSEVPVTTGVVDSYVLSDLIVPLSTENLAALTKKPEGNRSGSVAVTSTC